MSWSAIGYGLLCVFVPVAWGLLVYWISGAIERRVLRSDRARSGKAGTEHPADEIPLDYHI